MLLAQRASPCRPPDAVSNDLVRELTAIAAAADPTGDQLRLDMALPKVSADSVRFVTDDTVCARLVPVYNANTRSFDSRTGVEVSTPTGQLYVVEVGGVYVAWDPGAMMGEFRRVLTVDRTGRVLANSLH